MSNSREPLVVAQRLLEFAVITVCVLTTALTLAGIAGSIFSPDAVGKHDYIEYWASGQRILHGTNPYDPVEVMKLERAAGFPSPSSLLIMGNPPWALPLVLPLGLTSARTGQVLWTLALLAALISSVQMLRSTFKETSSKLHLLSYVFAPALMSILAGQLTPFLLLGIVLFLRYHLTRPFIAGASLWLCMLKPHLFLPFGLTVLIWCVAIRNFRLIAGAITAFCATNAIAMAYDAKIWSHYLTMMHSIRMDRAPMPCLSSLLRQAIPPHAFWLQCLPSVAGGIWALIYYRQKQKDWRWSEDGVLVLLISVIVAPYTWFMDQIVILPAVLRGAYVCRSRTMILLLVLLSAVIELEMFRGLDLVRSQFFLWTTPIWLLWYLVAIRRRPENNILPHNSFHSNDDSGAQLSARI
jgi:hypothetical protein